MSKSVLLPKNCISVFSSPFSFLKKENGESLFSGGIVNSNLNEFKVVNPINVKDSEEFFLNIKREPLSSRIKEVKVINKEELIENREKEDDLLNIYLPVARQLSLGGVANNNTLNSNFNFINKTNEIRMSGFYKEGKVFLSGFVVFNKHGQLIQVFKNSEIEVEEGGFILISFSGKIKISESQREFFFVDDLSLEGGDESLINISNEEILTKSNAQPTSEELNLQFKYPIGVVLDGNYVTLSRGNVSIEINKEEIEYFSEMDGDTPIYETKAIYSLSPTFS